jgi:hypothetical protein
MPNNRIKRLFFDCETSPNVVFSWRVGYKISLDYENIIKERALVCIGYKWEGDSTVHCLQWDSKHSDKAMLERFIPILESADEVVAHYGDRFDLPWIRARAAFHGLSVSPYIKSIDTKAQSSKLFYFNSNRLDYLAQFLGLGQKIDTDFDLWKRVVSGDKSALREMVAYCKHDVALLEKVYQRLESYNKPKTHVGVLLGGQRADCPYCASTNMQKRGTRVTGPGTVYQILQCNGCRKYQSVPAGVVAQKVKKEKADVGRTK